MRRVLLRSVVLGVVSLLSFSQQSRVVSFVDPIDALSVGFADDDAFVSVSGWDGDSWTPWQTLALENEQDPTLRESNLILFPASVSRVRFRGNTRDIALHPIRVSKEPAHYSLASTAGNSVKPKILTRRDWGADESLLHVSDNKMEEPPVEKGNGNGAGEEATENRIRDCEEARTNYPEEFKVARTVSEGQDGKRLRWPQQYMKEVRLLVVHHTAIAVSGDGRSGVERVRALYQFHAENRGWGDVGYHYLIDEEGQIYQGRAGGGYVVGGHVYCNNVGTVGIAMLGNFDVEQPTQTQIKALQWLLDDLAKIYEINLWQKVSFHGKQLQPVVGHRALVTTDCPGYYVSEALGQIRINTANDDVDAEVRFPPLKKAKPKPKTETVVRRVKEKVTRRTATILRKINRAGRLSDRVPKAPVGENVQRKRSKPARSLRPSSRQIESTDTIRIRLTKKDKNLSSCAEASLGTLQSLYRGALECVLVDNFPAIINEVSLEDYMVGLAEEPDSESFEKQRAFAIAARTYVMFYMDPKNRKFPGKPYDGSDDPAVFQAYGGIAFEKRNPRWSEAVASTAGQVLMKDGAIIKAPYFSTDDGRTRTPEEAGWLDFPFPEIFSSKSDPWCNGMELWGHGVGMSGCGAGGQAREGKTAEEILQYYYPGTAIGDR